MQQSVQCNMCNSNLEKTGFQFTTQMGGDFVVCTTCSSFYIIRQDIDYFGQPKPYLQPVQVPEKMVKGVKEALESQGIKLRPLHNEGLTNKDASDLKDKIARSENVTDFLNALDKEDDK